MLKDSLVALVEAFVEGHDRTAVFLQSKSDPTVSVTINETVAFPSASVIKPAIACAVADQGTSLLDKLVKVSDLDETFYCSIMQAFDADDQISIKALIGLMLIVSDNPATSAVLEFIGMDKVNAWLLANGLRDTNLDVGFDDASLGAPLRTNLTTAKDCLRLLQLIDTRPDYAFIRHMLANNLRNERIPKLLPDDAVIAHKTGTLAGLAHDIALIESPIAAYYLVVLADGLPDGYDFATEIARFSERVYQQMAA